MFGNKKVSKTKASSKEPTVAKKPESSTNQTIAKWVQKGAI